MNNDIVLTKKIFTGLASLERLDLSDCDLTYLKQGVFDEVVNLYQLDLSWNRLSEIRYNQFARLQNLLHLDLSYGPWYIQFHPFSFAGPSELTYLKLDKTKIRKSISFAKDVFVPLHKIEELYIVGFCSDLESQSLSPRKHK